MNFSIISSYTITTTTLAHEYFLSVSSLTLISGLLPIFSDYFSNNVSTNYSYTDLLFYFISSLALRYLILFFSVKLIISILMLNILLRLLATLELPFTYFHMRGSSVRSTRLLKACAHNLSLPLFE
jgi:hypothetical protein